MLQVERLTLKTSAMNDATLASSFLVDHRSSRPSPISILSGRMCVSPKMGCGCNKVFGDEDEEDRRALFEDMASVWYGEKKERR